MGLIIVVLMIQGSIHRIGNEFRACGVGVQAVRAEQVPSAFGLRVEIDRFKVLFFRDGSDQRRDLRDAVELRVVRDIEETVDRRKCEGRRAEQDARLFRQRAVFVDQFPVLLPERLVGDPVSVLGIVRAKQDDHRIRQKSFALLKGFFLAIGLVAGALQRSVIDGEGYDLGLRSEQFLKHGRISANEEHRQRAAVGHAVPHEGDMLFSVFASDGKPDGRIAAQDGCCGKDRR